MRAVVQRVSRARVSVDGSVTGEITTGLLILLGVGRDDTSAVATALAERIANLRIFEDDQRKMNRSLLDVKASALVVSQFTLYGDARGQRRPSFVAAAAPEQAKRAALPNELLLVIQLSFCAERRISDVFLQHDKIELRRLKWPLH